MGWANDLLISLRLPQNAQPNDPQILIGPELPPCMQTDFTAAAFWIPPNSQVGVLAMDAPLFFIAQQTVTGGAGSQTVTEGFVFYDPTISACGYIVTRRYVASGPPGAMSITQFIGPVPATGSGITMAFAMQIVHDSNTRTSWDGAGSQASVTNGGLLFVGSGSELEINPNGTLDYGGSASTSDDEGALSTTNTSYALQGNVVAGTIIGSAFVAPPSGFVWVHLNAGMDNTTAAGQALMSYEIRAGNVVGSGTVFQAASDARAITLTNTDGDRVGLSRLVTGLTPGTTYNVSGWHRSSAGANTAAFASRFLGVQPSF